MHRFLIFRPGQLSGRFAALVILFSSLIALVITAAELGYEYVRDLRQIDGRMAQIRDSYVDSVTENLWVADKERLNTQLQGIVRLPDFVLAEIRVDGRTEVRQGTGLQGDGITQVFALQRWHLGRLQNIGELVVAASYDGAFDRMLQRVLIFLLANGLKTLLVAMFIIVLFYRLIGRHVEQISLYAHEHDTPDKAPDLTLHRIAPARPDELSELVLAINHLRHQLLEHVLREAGRAEALEHQVAERTAKIREQQDALRLARDEAEWASRAKSHFLSSMSHELRTPLNAVLGFARLLEMSELNEADRQSVRSIIEGGEQLLVLIDNALQLTAGEAARQDSTLELLHLPGLLQENEEGWRNWLARSGMRFELDAGNVPPNLLVRAQKAALLQALTNYLANANKYGKPAGTVRVILNEQQGRVRIAVTNEGEGMTAQQLSQLFMPFQRLGREKSNVLGAGLGLSVTREVVEAMGGQVGVESTPGQGATFWIDLPVVT